MFLHVYKYVCRHTYYMYVCICKNSSYRKGHVFRRTEEMGGERGRGGNDVSKYSYMNYFFLKRDLGSVLSTTW